MTTWQYIMHRSPTAPKKFFDPCIGQSYPQLQGKKGPKLFDLSASTHGKLSRLLWLWRTEKRQYNTFYCHQLPCSPK